MEGHILLFNKPAEKQDAWPVSIIKRVSSVDALKGELLIAIPRDKIVGRSDGAKPHNYRLVKDETISLRAETEDVAPLSDHEFHLLEAIKSPLVCYEAFVSDKVEWERSLKLGYIVYVTIPGKTPTSNVRVSAIVRYAGQTTSHSGILFGVEIMDEAYHRYGTTDGTYHGTRHFTCKDNCGLFVALDRISPARDHGSTHTEPLREGQSQQYDHRYDLRSQPKISSVDDTESQFKVGERVIVYSKKNVAIHGTVMWAGVVSDGKALRVLTVGVETDIPVKREDFEDALPMKTQMFKVSASHHGRVYLPEVFVVREQPLNREQPAASSFNVQHRDSLAKTYGYQYTEMLHEQSEALRQAKQGKEAKELEEIQKAVQTEQIDADKQREALREMEGKKKAAAAAKLQHSSSGSKISGAPHFGSQASFPGSHSSSDHPGSAATQTPYARQHSSHDVSHLYDTADVRDTAEAQYGARGYNQGQQQPPSQYINPESTAWSQSSSHEALRQHGTDQRFAVGINATTSTPMTELHREKEHFKQECSRLQQQLSQQTQAKERLEQEHSQLQQQQTQASQELQQACIQ